MSTLPAIATALFGIMAGHIFRLRRALSERTTWLFVAGIALFCGSLYALALGAPSAVGFATPFGGAAFIAGWLMLACSTWRLPVAPRSDAR
mgnify:CR=1 FL=1